MNPPVNNSFPAGLTFYQNENGLFNCPVHSCGMVYSSPVTLNNHISGSHVFPQNPQPQNLQLQNPSQYLQTQNVQPVPRNSAGVPLPPTYQTRTLGPIAVVEGAQHNSITRPSSHPHLVSAPASATSSPLSQSNPLSLSHRANWSESIEWPLKIVKLLRNLIIRHGLFSKPETVTEDNKLRKMYREFYTEVAFPIRKPRFEDETLCSLFESKISEIQIEMIKSGEVYKTREGYKVSKLPQQNLQIDAPPKEMPISTPPTTPNIPSDAQSEALKLWNSLDSCTQKRLFRDQLRSAKDAQSLIFECDKYCTEIRRKEGTLGDKHVTVNTSAIDKRREKQQIITPAETIPSETTPSETPPPTQPPKTIDLNSMIEIRLREANLKRQRLRETGMAKEGRAKKRLKVEPE